MEICLVIRLKTVITPTDLLCRMLKRVVSGVHETVILLVVLMVFGLQEETKLYMREIKMLR
jgi:hypothetical protein